MFFTRLLLRKIRILLPYLYVTVVLFLLCTLTPTLWAKNATNYSASENFAQDSIQPLFKDTITLRTDTTDIGVRTYIIKHRAAVTLSDTLNVGMQIIRVNYWDVKNLASLSITQTGYSRWADGGENSMTLSALDDFYATYIRKNFMFASYAKSSLAYLITSGQKPQKTEDRIDLKTSVGYNFYKNDRKWYGATYLTMISQFANGYNSNGVLVSSFLAPATTTLSLGVMYQPNKRWTFFFAPLSGSSIFVLNQELADKGTGGVAPAEYVTIINPDSTASKIKIKDGDKTKLGLGFFAEVTWRQKIHPNVDIDTKLRLSNNYIDKRKNNRWNFDVDYMLGLNFTITKYLSANVRMHFLYDDDIPVTYKKKIDGEEFMHTGPTLQFKEIIGLGLMWKFSNQ